MDVEHWRATVCRTIRIQPRENVRLADLIEGDLPEPRDYVLVQILLCTVTRLLVAKQAIKIPLRQIAEGRGTSEWRGSCSMLSISAPVVDTLRMIVDR